MLIYYKHNLIPAVWQVVGRWYLFFFDRYKKLILISKKKKDRHLFNHKKVCKGVNIFTTKSKKDDIDLLSIL